MFHCDCSIIIEVYGVRGRSLGNLILRLHKVGARLGQGRGKVLGKVRARLGQGLDKKQGSGKVWAGKVGARLGQGRDKVWTKSKVGARSGQASCDPIVFYSTKSISGSYH